MLGYIFHNPSDKHVADILKVGVATHDSEI